jgi:sulfide:quinone oxidoreductase
MLLRTILRGSRFQGKERAVSRFDQDPLRVLVAGAGVAALEVTLALRELAGERVAVELVAPEREFVYRPLAVAEPFRVGEMRRFPLEPLVEAAGGRLRPARVGAVDAKRHLITAIEGDEISYDVLVLALGAHPVEAVPGATTFRGPEDTAALDAVLADVLHGGSSRIVFALPDGHAWPLPLYELALLTWSYLTDRGATRREIAIVTPEAAPLEVFGSTASEGVRELLAIRAIELHLQSSPVSFADGFLQLAPEGALSVDRVVALPRLEGPRIPGVPHDDQGFVPTDRHGRVSSLPDIYAAGDLTSFPIKHGGIAAQQADTVAAAIAARAGAPVRQTPFRPVLRGQLLTGMFPRFLRGDPVTGASTMSTEALWWPPAKVAGRHLAPFLAAQLGLTQEPPPASGVPVEIPL